MFDQIDLITVKQIKNKNGEKIDQEERFTTKKVQKINYNLS